MVRLIFTRKNTIGSWLIRIFTWSKWSHVGFICRDRTVIEAVGFHGVRRVSMAESVKGATKYAIVDFKNIDSIPIENILVTKLGNKYDYLGAIGMGLHKKWENKNKWVCSELINWGFNENKTPLFRADEEFKITQQNIWVLQPDGDTSIVSPNNELK